MFFRRTASRSTSSQNNAAIRRVGPCVINIVRGAIVGVPIIKGCRFLLATKGEIPYVPDCGDNIIVVVCLHGPVLLVCEARLLRSLLTYISRVAPVAVDSILILVDELFEDSGLKVIQDVGLG